MALPEFPRFKPLELSDRGVLNPRLKAHQPRTSELTFTNLFIWRKAYGFEWSILGDALVVLAASPSLDASAEAWTLPPVGPSPRQDAARRLLRWMKDERGLAAPAIRRTDRELAEELEGLPEFAVAPVRDDFDYVYRTRDLIELAGARFHGKRNHIRRFVESRAFVYEPMAERHIGACLELAEAWCALRRCEDDLGLMGEWEAIREAFGAFRELELEGGVILVEGLLKAFSLGERLNDRTAVIHIEKADPEMQGLYPLINREFCRDRWSGTTFINREQDLGEPGLRRAKLSYHPDHLEEKFTVQLLTRFPE